MKYALVLACALVIALGFAPTARGDGDGDGIVGSPHDFSAATWNARLEICRVCHVPHDHNRDLGDIGLLWNHQLSTETYTMYAYDSHVEFIDGAAETQPVGTAKMCLACHDGSIAVDAFDKYAGGDAWIVDYHGGDFKVPNHPSNAYDLSNTHPLSVAYDFAGDGGLAPTSDLMGGSGTIADVLEDGMVQCMSCHDVHDSVGESVAGTHLLRVAQKGPTSPSGLCLTCHVK